MVSKHQQKNHRAISLIDGFYRSVTPPLSLAARLSLPLPHSRRPWKGEEARLVSAVARVAVTLDLEATGGSAAPREGRAVFTVYAFRTGGPGVISLFQEWDNWAVENRFAESFPLSETMKQIIQVGRGM